MTEYEPWELRLAWQEAWQVRGCPPNAILHEKERSAELERHLRSCPFCSEELEEGSPGSGSTEAFPLRSKGVAEALSQVKEPGQVWSVRRDLGGWGPGNRYFNPPLVMVVSRLEAPASSVRVVQVYHDLRLAGPGDVSLGEGMFAEPWNSFTLAESDLEKLWLSSPRSTLKEVQQAVQSPFTPLPEDSPPSLEAFRRMEVEVSAFFAMSAVARLLGMATDSPSHRIRSAFPDTLNLIEHLERRQPSLRVAAGFSDPLESLALVQFPLYERPLAAASHENRILLNRVEWRAGALHLTQTGAELTLWKEDKGGLAIGGRLEEATEPESELFAWWLVSGEPSQPADSLDFSPEEGFFRVYFSFPPEGKIPEGRLALLLCDPSREDPVPDKEA